MNTEPVIISKDTEEVVMRVVRELVGFVAPTYGPGASKVIIDKQLYHMAVDDGVQIARDFDMNLPEEKAVLKEIRQVAIRTNDRVGDGTTSSLIMLRAIMEEVEKKAIKNGREISEELERGAKQVRIQLEKLAQPVDSLDILKKVARISFNDPTIADLIASLYWQLGPDASVTLENSPGMEVTAESAKGISIKSGYVSPYMVKNPERMESVVEKPYILVTDYRLTETGDILPLMEKMNEASIKELVIISDSLEGSALATAIVNRVQGQFGIVAVNAPKNENLSDIALATGAKFFSHDKGDKLDGTEIVDLGRAESFVCRATESVIVKPKGKGLEQAISDLKAAAKIAPNESTKKEIEHRLAVLSGAIAVIKVGAHTESEQKALKYKIEDATHAVKAAFKSGVVPGGGHALASIKSGSEILDAALQAPMRQLANNLGKPVPSLKKGEAQNAITGESGPFLDVGVADPAEVLIAGVESAVSIASTLVTATGIIAEKRLD